MVISNKIGLISIAIYFVLIISTERLYYQKLFNISLDLIPEFQESIKNPFNFWNYITQLGQKPAIGFFYIIIAFFISLNQVFSLIFLLLFTALSDHLLKIIYLQERPLWFNEQIDFGSQHPCGYGNPSGHSLTGTCLYLSLWYFINLIIDKKINNKCIARILKITTFIFCSLIIILILISRFYLGVHSLNQIIYGFLIGLGIFFLFLPILKIYQDSGSEFLKKLFLYRIKLLLASLIIIIIFYIVYFCRSDIPGIEENERWKQMCQGQKWIILLKKGSFMGCMSIFVLLGLIIGLVWTKNNIDEQFNSKEDIIFRWEKENIVSRLIRIVLMLIGLLPVLILFLINRIFNFSYIFFYIAVPILFFISGFLSSGPCIIYGFKIILKKYGNEEINSLNKEQNKSVSQLVENSNEILN